ncbi:hypothetical protein PC120_g27232, partial [Phytophthora cactorum]
LVAPLILERLLVRDNLEALESERWRLWLEEARPPSPVSLKSLVDTSEARESARPMSKRVESAHEAFESNLGR